MITLASASKSYGSTHALRPTSITFERGATTVLVGPSGSGKSTILRLIVGLAVPSAGAVTFDGEAVGPDIIRLLRRRMGYVIQEGGLFPHLTAEDNVTLMARHLGWNPGLIGTRLRELAALAHLETEQLSRFPAQLSGGQRQRVSLIRALFLDPEVLLLDEPLGALDAVTRSALQGELKEIFKRLAKTVIIVTHDLAEAAFFADRMILMNHGEILQQGRPHDIVHAPQHPEVADLVNAYRQSIAAFIESDA